MDKSSVLMDSDSESDEYSPDSERINEIVAKAKDVERIQKPLLRELVNPCIEDDIRKNYRRSIVRRAVKSNNIFTSTPSASTAIPQCFNISSTLDLANDSDDNPEKNSVQASDSSNNSRSRVKHNSPEEMKEPNQEIEVMNVSVLDNFNKPPLLCASARASTSALNITEKTKATELNDNLIKKASNKTVAGKQMMNLSAETSLLRKNAERSHCSGVVLGHEGSSEIQPETDKQKITQTEIEDMPSNEVEHSKENGLPKILSNTRNISLRRGKNYSTARNEDHLEQCNKSKVEGDYTQQRSRRKNNRLQSEDYTENTRKSNKSTKRGELYNTDSNCSIYESPKKKKNKLRHEKKLNSFTEYLKDSASNSIRHKNNQSQKFSAKEKNIVRRRTSKYDQRDISGSSSVTDGMFDKKKELRDDYILNTLRGRKKPHGKLDNTQKCSKNCKRCIYSDYSTDRSPKKKQLKYDKKLNNVSTDSMGSITYSTKSKPQRVPVKVKKQRNTRGRASKYHYQSDISSFEEKHTGRSQKKQEQNKVGLKHDKYCSKSKYKTNVIDASDSEYIKDERNRKTKFFRRAKSFPRKRYESFTSISSSASFIEYDKTRTLQDNSEDSFVKYKNVHLLHRKSRGISAGHVKYEERSENKYSKECRGKSVPRRTRLRSTKCYKRRYNSSSFEKEDDKDVTITNKDGRYSRHSKMKKKEMKMNHEVTSAEEYRKYKNPIGDVENNVSITNSDIISHPYVPKKSLELMVTSLVKKAFKIFESGKRLGEIAPVDVPIETQKDVSEKFSKALPQATQQNKNASFIAENPEISFVYSNIFPSDSRNSTDMVSFRNSRTPSIFSNKEGSFQKTISRKQLARKPFTNSDNNKLSATIRFRDRNFCFINKKKKAGIKIIRKKKCSAIFQKCEEIPSKIQTVIPISGSSGNSNCRKSLLSSERKAIIKAKLDEILGFDKNVHNVDTAIQYEPRNLDAATQFSLHSQKSLSNGNIHTSNNGKETYSLKVTSSKKSSKKKTRKLSVATQSSPFIDVFEENDLTVTSDHVSNNTRKSIQYVEVDKDAGHSGNIESSTRKIRNTRSKTSQNENNKYRSRTKLTFNEDITNNKECDLISPVVEFEENYISSNNSPHKRYESHPSKNDFLTNSDGFTNGDTSRNESYKDVEQIKLLDSCYYLSNEQFTNVDEIEEVNSDHSKGNVYTSTDQSKIKIIQNITLQRRGNMSSSSTNISQSKPLSILEMIDIEDRIDDSKPVTKLKKDKTSKQKKAKVTEKRIARDTRLDENSEKLEGIRKSSRSRRPPQVIWWKSAIVAEDVDLVQYYKKCGKVRCGETENRSTSNVQKDTTNFKTRKLTKKNTKLAISTERVVPPKMKKVATKTSSREKQTSTSKATRTKKVTRVDNNIPPFNSEEDKVECSADVITFPEDFSDPGYVTSSRRLEQNLPAGVVSSKVSTDKTTKGPNYGTNSNHLVDELELKNGISNVIASIDENNGDEFSSEKLFTELCNKVRLPNTNKNNENISVLDIGQSLSMGHHFGYMVLAPAQFKRAINVEYDTVYFIIEGTCTMCTDSENVIKGPKQFLNIKQGIPYQITNSGLRPLLLIFMCFQKI